MTLLVISCCTLAVIIVSPSSASNATQSSPTLPALMAEGLAGQLPEHISEQTRDLIKNGSRSVWACASCHGEHGEGRVDVPRLAGLPGGYLAKQMHSFKDGSRRNGSMRFVADALSDEQILAIAAYYERLDAPSGSKPAFGVDTQRGSQLAIDGLWEKGTPSCFSCHGALGWGRSPSFPALAAQQPIYIVSQLNAWKHGTRTNSPVGVMHSVAASLSEKDMQSLADYFAGLPAPQPDTPKKGGTNE